MDELTALRGQIDAIDKELTDLFVRRMAVTHQVGEYKVKNHLPVLDRQRERQLLSAKTAQVGDDLRADVTTLFETIMALSRRQQQALADEGGWIDAHRRVWSGCRLAPEKPRVLYQGEPGAYADEAAAGFFGEEVPRDHARTWEDVFRALKEGKADYGVVPIENSSTGSISQVYDLLAQYGAYIVGEHIVKVDHCLAAPAGVREEDITAVYSHEQGLLQCAAYLKAHPGWEQVPRLNTAESALFVARDNSGAKAAVCSPRAAKLYGLNILREHLNESDANYTRFVVVSPVPELREGRNKVSATFTLAHESGTLHRIMTVFATGGLNLMKLESRPIPGRSWEYRFFVDFTGDLTAYGMDSILREMSQCAAELRILGNYKADPTA